MNVPRITKQRMISTFLGIIIFPLLTLLTHVNPFFYALIGGISGFVAWNDSLYDPQKSLRENWKKIVISFKEWN